MVNIKESKRYIDDGAGFYIGSERSFKLWMKNVNEKLHPFGLSIDEFIIKEVGVFVPFLDIQFCFNIDRHLQTDLYIKPTDSRSYLHYSSAHPHHIFSGIVFSQCLRLRRIINDQSRLESRLKELCKAFEKSGYPKNMLRDISTKVLNTERESNLYNNTTVTVGNSAKQIPVISCHGTDDKLVKTLMKHEDDLLKTDSFKSFAKPLFKFVKRTAPNIGSKLSVLKSIALDNRNGKTTPCYNHRNCKCCNLIGENVDEVFGKPVKFMKGNCKTRNVIYLVTCRLCTKPYIGRSTQPLGKRMAGHRECYYKVLRKSSDVDSLSDEYSLGIHLTNEHGCMDETDFDDNLNVQILSICGPGILDKNEHIFIHKYNTLAPIGLNKTNPFGLSVLR